MEETKIIINFRGLTCTIRKSQYINGRTALQLIDVNDGMQVAMATVNIPEEKIEEDEVIIKNYSENEGLFMELYAKGVVGKCARFAYSGHIVAPIAKLLL
jgi:hypothetical protein